MDQNHVYRASVPGRICLVGDHCDYAKGMSVALPLQQRVTAYGELRDDQEVAIVSSLEDQVCRLTFSLDNIPRLEDNPLRYSAAAVQVLKKYHAVGGLSVTINSNLPPKKGLGSSAAVSVATIKLFNDAYHLNLSRDDLARLAYESEHDLLGVKCGKMDQIVAAYETLVAINFMNGNNGSPEVSPLTSPQPMHLLVGIPSTTRRALNIMLSATNSAYRSPTTKQDHAFCQALDDIIPNTVVKPFIQAVQYGDPVKAGSLLRLNQEIYDSTFIPVCESFEAPIIHRYLQIAKANGSLGEKWTGAGGDGAFICLAASPESRDNLQQSIEKKSSLEIHFVTVTI